MRYAIAADGDRVASHFGRCERYVLVDVHGGEEIAREELLNPGHEPGLLPRLLNEEGVACVVAGGAGPRAVGLMGELNIAVRVGVRGPIDAVVEQIAAGRLESGESACEH
ncbi:MAG: NifB/NifX family molybdenum-iron cluster-binding protein [Armatimonadota bacterium]|jgi:predicted Fe-Mo cluster-binding NifX family protein